MRALCYLLSISALVLAQSSSPDNGTQSELLSDGDALPVCAASCLADLAPQFGCEPNNAACTCVNTNLTLAAGACAAGNCTIRELLTTQRVTSQTCSAPVRDQRGRIRTLNWALFAISVTFICLRCLSRTRSFDGPGFGADDWTMLAILVFLVPASSGLELMLQNGLGQDMWMIQPLDKITDLLMYILLGEIWYTNLIMLTKVSILLLYLRIFPASVASRWFRPSVWILISACAAADVAFVLSIIFQCKTPGSSWKSWDGTVEAQCVDTFPHVISMAGINILLDLLVFFLPIPRLLKLEISTRKRVGVCLTFLAGLFVTIVSVVRVVTLVQFIEHAESGNTSWDFVHIADWSQIEINVGIWCACMPALTRLVKKFWVEVLGQKLSTYFSRGDRMTSGNVASIIKSRVSQRTRVDSDSEVELNGRVKTIPDQGVSKTVESRIVYDRRFDSSDEVGLVDKQALGDSAAMYHHQKYTRQW